MVIKSTITKVLLMIVTIVIIGTIGFKITGGEEWTIVDSLYMSIITLSTVGFQEVHALNMPGRVWTIIVISLGIGIVAFAISQLTQSLMNFDLFRRRKMVKKINHLKNHFIVCGYGRMGKVICEELAKQKLPFVVIENNPEKVAKIEENGYLVFASDATLDETLIQARIENAKGMVVVLSSDADNLYVTMSARTLNKDIFITSRCSQHETNSKLRRAGADKIVNPYTAGGHKMAELLITPEVEDSVELSTPDLTLDLVVEEIRLDGTIRYDGVKIQESKIREDYNLLIVSIITQDGDITFNPNADFVLFHNQTIMVIGQKEDLKSFKESFQDK